MALSGAMLMACSDVARPRGVYRVADVARGELPSSPAALTPAGGLLYFTADDGLSGRELWRSDGTQAGTRRVSDTIPDVGLSAPAPLAELGGWLFFSAARPIFRSLWRSDGTPDGTTHVPGPILPGSQRPVELGGALFFPAQRSLAEASTLWRSDGTPEGTYPLTTLAPFVAPRSLARLGDALYFFAFPARDEPEAGRDVDALWRSDGTVTGTSLVRAFQVRPFESLSALVAAGGALYFRGYDSAHGYGLWTSDGTPAGTRFVIDADLDRLLDETPAQLTPFGARVAFTGEVIGGARVWVSDGTAAGTLPLVARPLAIRFGLPDGGRPHELTVAGGQLFFTAEGALWRSDGTQAGTVRLRDDLGAAGLAEFDGALVFAGTDAERGRELWRSDGTLAGTLPLADVVPGLGSSTPANLRVLGDTLYFSADDGRAGRELWAYGPLPPPGPSPTPRGPNRPPEIAELRVEPLRPTSRTIVFRALDAEGDNVRWSAELTRLDGGPQAGILSCESPCDGVHGTGPQLGGPARAGREVRIGWFALSAPPGELSVTVQAVDELGAAAVPRRVTFTFAP